MKPLRWLAWLLPARDREFALGDLEELYGRSWRGPLELLRAALSLRWARATSGSALSLPSLPSSHPDRLMPSLLADFRYGLRQLGRSPAFTALAVLSLALGIGATSTVFSVVNPVLLRPLPYPGGERVITVWDRDAEGGESNTGYPTFLDVQRMATTLQYVAVASEWMPTLQGGAEPERLRGQRVTGDYFSVLGVHPALGRDFSAEENLRGKHRVTILSHGLWARRFGSDPAIVGRSIQFDGIAYTVVGVMPRDFENLFGPAAQLWAPLAYDLTLPWACRTCRHLREIARVRTGVSLAAVRRELEVLSRRVVAEHPREYSRAGFIVVPLQSLVSRELRPTLLAVLGAVAFVLLIACANVSGLLLGRALQRDSEFAIRAALGAGRRRVVRQLLTESLLLSGLGGASGLLLAWSSLKAITTLGPERLPRLAQITLDWRVLLFTAGLSVACGLLFGLLPALAAARPDLFASLRPGGGSTGLVRRRARRALVVSEIALALVLLMGAGLLLRSLQRLLAVPPGFQAEGLLTLEVQTTGTRYNDAAMIRRFFAEAGDAIRALPGVVAAGWTSQLPLGGNFDRYGVWVEGVDYPHPEEAPSADRYAVSPGYLEAMRIPLRAGRRLAAQDDSAAPMVAVINETYARTGWPGVSPLGRRIRIGGGETPWRTVVGVVADVRHTALDERQAPQVYLPESQWRSTDDAMVLAVRTRGDPAALIPATRAALRTIDRQVPILHVATMEDVVLQTTEQRRLALRLFQAFALVALLLAAAGIYGVLSASVTERTREIGIRAALGASRHGLVRLVLRQGIALLLSGLALGTAGVFLLTRYLGRLLFAVGAQDPLTFAAVTVVLTAVALLACWAPAWRATRVSPLQALRAE